MLHALEDFIMNDAFANAFIIILLRQVVKSEYSASWLMMGTSKGGLYLLRRASIHICSCRQSWRVGAWRERQISPAHLSVLYPALYHANSQTVPGVLPGNAATPTPEREAEKNAHWFLWMTTQCRMDRRQGILQRNRRQRSIGHEVQSGPVGSITQ